jgi:Uma2 family endonuclease
MAEPSTLSGIEDEHEFYPVHEEDSVPQTPLHLWQNTYFLCAIQSQHPELWVTGDTCLYWERGNTRRYVAPDVAVIDCAPPAEPHNVWLSWSDPPLLFVAEIGSRSTLVEDTGPKVATFEQHLRVPEYLYADPPKGDLRLWRMVEGVYQRIPADERGRMWSAQLELAFGYDDRGFLRAYTAAGEMLLTHEEERQRREVAEQAAEQEARRREDAERRLAEMTAELERLRRLSGETGAP